MEGEKQLSDFLRTDIATRIISFILAIIVWIYVVILLDPEIDITINDIPVLYTNTITLTNEGYILTNEKNDTVSVRIRGSRTMLSKVNKPDIMAFIDLNGYNQTGTFSLPITVRLPFEELSVVEKKPYGINVTIDKRVTQSFPVTVEITGTPQAGFEVYETIPSQSTAELTGPGDLVASIEKVVAKLDVSNVSNDILVTRNLTFYNTNNDIVTNKHLTSQPESVELRCEVLKRKTVPVKPVMDSQHSNYLANVITNNNIVILGKPEVLDKITEIYTKPISVSDLNESSKKSAKLDIPDDIVTLDGISEVTVEISRQE